jgi:hypothetical protein
MEIFMNIDRDEYQGGIDTAIERVSFCLDQLEKAENFKEKIDWDTEIVPRLTIEEMICALVSAEQQLNLEEELQDPHELTDIET